MLFLSFIKSYRSSCSLLVELLYFSFGNSIFIKFSSELLMHTSMAAYLLVALKVDFGLNRSRSNSSSSFLRCYFNHNILLSTSKFRFKLCLIYCIRSQNKIKSFWWQRCFRIHKVPPGQIHDMQNYFVIYYPTSLPHYLLHLTY